MNRRRIALLGVLFLIIGCVTSAYLGIRMASAWSEGVFAAIRTDSPNNRFSSLRCPLLLSVDETFYVVATISNPTVLDYDIAVESDGFDVLSHDREDKTAPNDEIAEITWSWDLRARESGPQTLVIQAHSHKDLALPGIFHMWPTSYLHGCGILVLNAPLTGKQVLFLSSIMVLVGAVISLPRFSEKIRERFARKRSAEKADD